MRMATQLTLGQLWRTPLAVDARGPLRADQSEIPVALELDALVVADLIGVGPVLVLAHFSDQEHPAVCYVARVRAPVCI